MRCKIPGTAREIVESLMIEQGYSVKEIALMVGVTPKTVYRIKKGFPPLPRIHLTLIQLYIDRYRKMYEELMKVE